MRDKTIYLAGENLANAGNRKDMTDYPRVTDILSIINSEELNYLRGRLGNEGFEEMMNQKGDLGTSTHQDCYLVNRGLAPCPDARTKAMVEAYQRWFVTCVSKVIASEIPLPPRHVGRGQLNYCFDGVSGDNQCVQLKLTGGACND